jgi:O-methyltransferase domain/Dimerisation domain
MNDRAQTSAERLRGLIDGFWAVPVISAAVQLEIPELLAAGPKDSRTLARETGAHAPSLHRLLRALETLGLCTVAEGETYALTDTGQLLRADSPESLRGRALHTADMLSKQLGDLYDQVRTGGRTKAFPTGSEGFEALKNDPARLHKFQTNMAEGSRRAAQAAMRVYDFSPFARLLDLGGGYGGVLAELLRAYPHQKGAVCDLPYLEDGALDYLSTAGVGGQSNFVRGDFFASVPDGYDLLLMKYILHDWDDENALRILRNVRAAAGNNSQLVAIEQIVPESLTPSVADQDVIRADLVMMSVGGKERTAAEYRALFADSGWNLASIVPTGTMFSLLEGKPA